MVTERIIKSDIERILVLLNELPAQDRWVVYWHGTMGMTFEEISKLLKISRQAVHRKYAGAIDKIYDMYNQR